MSLQEPAAWQWRKRFEWHNSDGLPYYCWSEWEQIAPPYMDAKKMAVSDPANYEVRPLFLAPTPRTDMELIEIAARCGADRHWLTQGRVEFCVEDYLKAARAIEFAKEITKP